MARIVRGDWSPPGYSYGALGERHPTLPGWIWVTWLGEDRPKFNGYYRRSNLILIGTSFTE